MMSFPLRALLICDCVHPNNAVCFHLEVPILSCSGLAKQWLLPGLYVGQFSFWAAVFALFEGLFPLQIVCTTNMFQERLCVSSL